MSVSAIYFDKNLMTYYEFRPVFEFVFGDYTSEQTPGY